MDVGCDTETFAHLMKENHLEAEAHGRDVDKQIKAGSHPVKETCRSRTILGPLLFIKPASQMKVFDDVTAEKNVNILAKHRSFQWAFYCPQRQKWRGSAKWHLDPGLVLNPHFCRFPSFFLLYSLFFS